MTSRGDRDGADEIRYKGRERERQADCQSNRWGSSCLILTEQSYVSAYGIGLRVFGWVLALSFTGAALLWLTVPAAKQHGFIWCFGASLAQLLPAIEINKEFTEFFYDPERTRLKNWHIIFFSALSVFGLLLGAALIATFADLTH